MTKEPPLIGVYKLKGTELECQSCEAIFTVEHEELDPPSFCPFCGENVNVMEDQDEWGDLDEEEDDDR